MVTPQNGKRISKADTYLNCAEVFAYRSTCIKRKYGAVIVKDDVVISTGYNGAPRGFENCCDLGKCPRIERDMHQGDGYGICRAVHAEANALLNCSRQQTIGADLYLTGVNPGDNSIHRAKPCPLCARTIIQAGIRNVYLRVGDGADNYVIVPAKELEWCRRRTNESRRKNCMEWYTLFRPYILERGSVYYEDGLVTGFEYSDNEITAQVAGSDIYDVQIELDGEDVLDMYCSCPYAADGHNCKHMAAVLFQFEEELADQDLETEEESFDILQQNPLDRVQKDKAEVTELVAKIPEDKVRELLVGFVLSDESLRNRLQMQYSFKMNSKLMMKLRTELEQIQYRYSSGGFVDWYHASGFASELVGFLSEKVMFLIEKSCLKQAFELTNEVFYCIGNTDMDDSDGSSSYVADQCYECWKQIIEKSDEDFKNEIREWFEIHKTGYVTDYINEYIEEIILDEFATREMLSERIQKLDIYISRQRGNNCGKYYSAYYGLVDPVAKRIEYMRKMGCTDEEIREYRQANRHFSVIREMEISEALEKGDYKSAVSILLESKELDAGNMEQLKKYSEQLIDIYRKTGSEKAYCEELIYHLENFWQRDLSYVNALKKCISDQKYWKTVVDGIVAKNRYDEFVCSLLREEKQYEKLMEKIENSANKVSLLDDYGRILRKKFPERIIKIYSDYLKREAEMANDRKKYKRLMPYLKKIAGCVGGEAAAQEIADSWKREYRRRSAMMDELRKAGF